MVTKYNFQNQCKSPSDTSPSFHNLDMTIKPEDLEFIKGKLKIQLNEICKTHH